MDAVITHAQVMDIVGCHGGYPVLLCEIGEQVAQGRSPPGWMADQLDEKVTAEDLAVKAGGTGCARRIAFAEKLRHFTQPAAGEGYEPLVVAGEHDVRGGGRLIRAFTAVHGGEQAAQVGIARHVLAEEREMVAAFDIHLCPDDRLDAELFGGVVEPDGAGQPVVVGERQGGHAEMPGLFEELRRPGGAVQKTIIGMDMQMYE